MNDSEKLRKVKNDTKLLVIIYSMYGILVIYALGTLIFKNNAIERNIMIGMYIVTCIILLITLIGLFRSISILKNENKLRKKTINRYDERNDNIRQKSNTTTLLIVLLTLLLVVLISVFTNRSMVFAVSIMIFVSILIIRIIVEAIYKKVS